MSRHVRILLALLGCLVIGANALAAAPGHCDPLCCDEPCESGPLAPVPDCTCCAVRGSADLDPLLPPLAAPAPITVAAIAVLPAATVLPALAPLSDVLLPPTPPAPPPLPARSTILRL